MSSAVRPSGTATVVPFDDAAADAARARQSVLLKPAGSLGRLEDLAVWLAGVTGDPLPVLRPLVVVAAADHGVAAEGVSAYPQEVTGQMLAAFLGGGSAISAWPARPRPRSSWSTRASPRSPTACATASSPPACRPAPT